MMAACFIPTAVAPPRMVSYLACPRLTADHDVVGRSYKWKRTAAP